MLLHQNLKSSSRQVERIVQHRRYVLLVLTGTAILSIWFQVGKVQNHFNNNKNHRSMSAIYHAKTTQMFLSTEQGSSWKHSVLATSADNTIKTDSRIPEVVNCNETVLFWKSQSQLCRTLRNLTNTTTLGMIKPEDWEKTRILNVTADCRRLSKIAGEGNWITALYRVRIAVSLAGVDFQFQCADGRRSEQDLVLPWFSGYYPAPRSKFNDGSNSPPWLHGGTRPTEQEACTDTYGEMRIDKMSLEIQKDIQRIAVTLVGTSNLKQQQNLTVHPPIAPLFPNTTLDDVTIHFRCGDVFGGSWRRNYGIIHFSEYKKWISPPAKSIGILTQPFDSNLTRRQDKDYVDVCRKATHLLVDYLQDYVPNATITIRNSETETLPLAYARLALANQSFATLSTFGIFPVIGTFGNGYFQQGNAFMNAWASHVPAYLPNIHKMNAPALSTMNLRRRLQTNTTDEVLQWFVSDLG